MEDEESEIESSEIDSESSLYNLHDLNPKRYLLHCDCVMQCALLL